MANRTPEDRLLRACVWRILLLFIIAFWAAVIALAVPAIYANASTGPAHPANSPARQNASRLLFTGLLRSVAYKKRS